MNLPVPFEPPESKTVTFSGLEDILDRHTITRHWTIDMEPNTLRPGRGVDQVSTEIPVPKATLESAVEATDAFLQQAGVGLEIGYQQADDPDENPF
jgi:hypothetical protein